MKKLIKSGKYNAGKRPSEYNIGNSSFLNDNGGAIPSNVIIASNTTAKDRYIEYCKEHELEIHPARMPKEIPLFFIKFLTDDELFPQRPDRRGIACMAQTHCNHLGDPERAWLHHGLCHAVLLRRSVDGIKHGDS